MTTHAQLAEFSDMELLSELLQRFKLAGTGFVVAVEVERRSPFDDGVVVDCVGPTLVVRGLLSVLQQTYTAQICRPPDERIAKIAPKSVAYQLTLDSEPKGVPR